MVLKCLQSHGASSEGQQKGKCCDQLVGSAPASVHSGARQVLLADAYCQLTVWLQILHDVHKGGRSHQDIKTHRHHGVLAEW